MKLREKDGDRQVFDPLRRRWVALTPEEEVRQTFVEILIEHLGFPMGRLGNEISLTQNGLSRRCDTVIYGDEGAAIGIIEYKAPEVKITKRVFEQVMRYALALNTRWIMVSNGTTHFCAEICEGTPPECRFVRQIPTYAELTQ